MNLRGEVHHVAPSARATDKQRALRSPGGSPTRAFFYPEIWAESNGVQANAQIVLRQWILINDEDRWRGGSEVWVEMVVHNLSTTSQLVHDSVSGVGGIRYLIDLVIQTIN